MTRVRARIGFTLIELLVVIAIIGALVAMLLPAVQKVRGAAARVQCQNNLKQIALGLHNFHDAHEGFPPGQGYNYGFDPELQAYYGSWSGPQVDSTFIALLPFIEQNNLYNSLNDPNLDPFSPSGAAAQPIKSLLCPSDTLPNPAVSQLGGVFFVGLTSYGVNAGTQLSAEPPVPLVKDGIFHWNTHVRLTDVTDGTSSTLLAGENSHYEPLWMSLPEAFSVVDFTFFAAWSSSDTYTWRRPLERINYRLPNPLPTGNDAPLTDIAYKRLNVYGSQHSGGCNLAFVDGSIHFISENIDLTTLIALSTRANGEPIISDY